MIEDLVLLEQSSTGVVVVDADLFPGVDAILSDDRLRISGDPDAGQGVSC